MRDGTDEGRLAERNVGQCSASPAHNVVDADPVAACVQEIMATRSAWTGSGTDLLHAAAGLTR